jgi:asparagine synthase (glutamine-hydrolysing)
MIKFQIRRPDLSGHWRASPMGWAAGESCIEPFRNASLESYAVASSGCFLVLARERLSSAARPSWAEQPAIPWVDADEWRRILEEALKWPLQFIVLVIQLGPQGPELVIVSGPWGIGPLYVIGRSEEIIGSWDPVDLYPRLSGEPLDPALVCNFIASFDSPYSRRTMFREMWLLTERSRAVWKMSPQGAGEMEFAVAYPPAVLTPRPERLKPDADVLQTFWRILKGSLSRWLPAGFRGAGVELSGGLDSTIVALAAAELLDCPLATHGVILLDDMGEAQRARRQELVDTFGFHDTTVEMRDWIPFAPNSSRLREGPVVPWEDVYFEALDQLLAGAARQGTRLMLTGLGGDELCGGSDYDLTEEELAAIKASEGAEGQTGDQVPSFFTDEARAILNDTRSRLDTAPPSLTCSSGISAAACSSAMAMRHGLWTVSPLCTPELAGFCARLPLAWREDRAVERRLLSNLGCSANVCHPPQPDDFSPACRLGMRVAGRSAILRLFLESRLATLGLIDRDRLVADYQTWCDRNVSHGDLPFYATAVLERVLRAVEFPAFRRQE